MIDPVFAGRVRDMAHTACTGYRYIFSDFLTLAEQSDVLAMEKDLPAKVTFSGGYEGAERRMACFFPEEVLGYEEPFPITVLRISPVNPKFSDTMSHRDFLGAVLNLGIERRVTGDILTNGRDGYIFVESHIAKFISGTLERVKHTSVKVEAAENVPAEFMAAPEAAIFVVPSLRIDAVISRVFNISRKEAQQAINAGEVFVNSRAKSQSSYQPAASDLISVRGFGRFRFIGVAGDTRKGNLKIRVEVY